MSIKQFICPKCGSKHWYTEPRGTATGLYCGRLKAADSLNIITQTVQDIEHAAKRLTRDAQEIQAAADAITMKGEIR